MASRIVYITGFPAVGKSTLSSKMKTLRPDDIEVVSYGQLLMSLRGDDAPLSMLRKSPASKVDENLVRQADAELKRLVDESSGVVLIESHAVTVEEYGFRVIPFTSEAFDALGFTDILLLFDSPQRILQRTKDNPEGRPVLPVETISFAQGIQASVAFEYAMKAAVPLYCLDMSLPNQAERALSFIGL